MPKVKLPTHLFAFDFAPSIMTPGNDQYNGADISLATDANGNEYVGFTARELSTGAFGFVIWDLTRGKKVPYTPFCNARGEVNNGGRWVAWHNKDFYKGEIAGFVQHPNLVARIAALEARPAGGGGLTEEQTANLEWVGELRRLLSAQF